MTEDRLGPPRWRGWRLLPEVPALEYEDHEVQGYRVDLDRMDTSAEMLDWIFQIYGKPWGGGIAALLGFVTAVDDVLNPQANLCSHGVDRPFTPERLRARVAEYVRTGM